jgi:colicin import membrane protein
MSGALLHHAPGHDPLMPRPADGMGRGAMMALVVHGLLVLALAAAVNWRRQAPTPFSAEIWSALPEQAAPRPVAREPAPQPAPVPPPAASPAPPPAPSRNAADIALERQHRLEQERAARLERERAEQQARDEARAREREQQARRQREAEQALLKQQRELQKKRQEEAARQAEEARQAAALEAQRQENLKRMLGQAGATGSPSSRGSGARDAAPSAAYAGRIVAAIRPNIVLTDTLPPTLRAVVEVSASPTGSVLARRLVESSGNRTWDEAVLRAIDRTRQLPADTNGRVPPTLQIVFTPE